MLRLRHENELIYMWATLLAGTPAVSGKATELFADCRHLHLVVEFEFRPLANINLGEHNRHHL
jgi:hypothetical protein